MSSSLIWTQSCRGAFLFSSINAFAELAEQNCQNMKKITKLFNNKMHAFIALPLLVANLPFSFMGHTSFVPSVAEAIQINMEESEQREILETNLESQAAKIDAYFGKWNLPLTGYGMVFAKTAHKYDLDPFLLPAIAMRETTGGKFTCGGENPFGYGSCKIYFDSFEKAIDTVGKAISGEHEGIGYAYEGKDVRGILETYNPPSVVATYADEVMNIMDKISGMDISNHIASL